MANEAVVPSAAWELCWWFEQHTKMVAAKAAFGLGCRSGAKTSWIRTYVAEGNAVRYYRTEY